MTQPKRHIGSSANGLPIDIDLDRLIGSHACIVANSGGGKSGAIRRLLEVTHGQVQHIVLDIEDEFYTLRERFDYVIAGGDDADASATLANAASLALGALTHGFSLIVQMNDLGEDAPEFVGRFLTALVGAPRDLWRPVLVVLDETQRFAPQDGNTAATRGVKALTGQGRKRGFTAVLASQRIAKIDADVRGDVNNWVLGRVGQSLDRKTMADALGFAPSSAEARGLQGLPDRTFWGFGPALSRTPVLFSVADVETTPVRPGDAKVATPPPPEALRAILAGLAVVDASADNAINIVPGNADKFQAVSGAADEIAELRLKLVQSEEIARRSFEDGKRVGISVGIQRARAAIDSLTINKVELEGMGVVDNPPAHSRSKGPLRPESVSTRPPATLQSGGDAHDRPVLIAPSSSTPSPAALAIADLLDRVNPARLTWTQAAMLTGRKASGGNFNSARKWLRESGRIIEDGDLIRSSSDAPAGMTRAEALELWRSVLTNPAPKMIDALIYATLSKVELGEAIGAVPRGGNFNNGLAQLRRNGVVCESAGQFVLARPLPGEATP